nr:hypothetical protein GCM10020093_053760 [Planobispora longispora]
MASIKQLFRRFLERPGSIDLAPHERVVAASRAHEERLKDLAELPAPSMDDLAEFCAIAREAADRALGLRPYDVQLVGTLAMLSGNVAEMATGEGKTLSGAIAAAGYALRGRRVHVISVNDYLARRDAEWMEPLYTALGVSVGWIGQTSTPEERRAAYERDVTYGSVSEIGFDVLRDRLRTDVADIVVPEPEVALVDEADSVLVDEARVPLVLAGATDPGDAVPEMAALVRQLVQGYHYETDDQRRNVHLTSKGIDTVERALDVELYDEPATLAEVSLALHAHALLTKDVDYIVRDGKVHLINPSRGRVALLQRWPDGLQAAVEAKEALPASETGEILDSITVQGLITRYPERCGMTGTAVAVGDELREFYDLQVAAVPPNRPIVRQDAPDRLFEFAMDRDLALVEEIVEAHSTGRPILVGTLDVAESERLAMNLSGRGLECVVLNAKNDAEEASIIAAAGERGAITVSTQMAGRGTDIRLGDGVDDLGGLYVIGSGRHTSSRLDDQLRGRAGRQGDPGGSVFFVSGEDDLITHYVSDEYTSGSPPSGSSGTPSASPRASTPRSTATPGATPVCWSASGTRSSSAAAGCCAGGPPGTPWRRRSPSGGPRWSRRRARTPRTPPPGRSCSSTSTAAGRSTWPTWPRCARASTCACWAAPARSTSSTRRPSRPTSACSPRSSPARSPPSRPPRSPPTASTWRRRAQAPHRHLDLPRPGQPLRQRVGAHRRPPRLQDPPPLTARARWDGARLRAPADNRSPSSQVSGETCGVDRVRGRTAARW